MATYSELYALGGNTDLRNKIAVAAVIKAQAYIDGGTPTVDQLTWARATIDNPRGEAERLMNYVLAANKGATVAAIESATDAAIQATVDAAVDALVSGGV